MKSMQQGTESNLREVKNNVAVLNQSQSKMMANVQKCEATVRTIANTDHEAELNNF